MDIIGEEQIEESTELPIPKVDVAALIFENGDSSTLDLQHKHLTPDDVKILMKLLQNNKVTK
jgi:hypothetical protein